MAFRPRPRIPVPGWFLIRVWQFLHSRVCHNDRAPRAGVRWQRALTRFEDRHLADRGRRTKRATARFLNRYTAHRWL